MKFKMTIPSAILGLIVFIVVALQSFGKYNSGKWTGTAGIVVALAGAAIGLALAVTATSARDPAKSSPVDADAPTPTARKPSRQFRNSILLWLAVVVIFLLMFRLLDALHINWRQYLN
jgi:NADH:ubiquinone oxidoreductase subunit 6 (subunit J)